MSSPEYSALLVSVELWEVFLKVGFIHLVPSYKGHGHRKTEPENSAVCFGTIDRRSSECCKVDVIKYLIP